MKKIIVFICCAFIAFSSTNAFASEKESAKRIIETSGSRKLTKEERNILESRVKEIKEIKVSDLTASEKEELKNELLQIKEKLSAEPFTGIYLSAGAIIIILLILLIIT